MDKEIQSLDDHKVFDLVPLTTVPLKEKIKCHASSSTKTGTGHYQESGIYGPIKAGVQDWARAHTTGGSRRTCLVCLSRLDYAVAFLRSTIDDD